MKIIVYDCNDERALYRILVEVHTFRVKEHFYVLSENQR